MRDRSGEMRCVIRNEENDNDITTYLFCFLVLNKNWRHKFSTKFGITVRCYTTYSFLCPRGIRSCLKCLLLSVANLFQG